MSLLLEVELYVNGVLTDADFLPTVGVVDSLDNVIAAPGTTTEKLAGLGRYGYLIDPTVNGRTYTGSFIVTKDGTPIPIVKTATASAGSSGGSDFYPCTFLTLKTAATHAIGGAADTNSSVGNIVNRAILDFCNMHTWMWKRKMTTLNTISGQNYIDLPDDFGRLVVNQELYTPLMVGLDMIMWLRTNAYVFVDNMLQYRMAVNYNGSTSPRLELWPTPQSNNLKTFSLCYDMIPRALVNDTDVPPVPPSCYSALEELVKAKAQTNEEDADNVHWAAFKEMFKQLVLADTELQPNLGRMRGATEMRMRRNDWPPYPLNIQR